MKILLEYFIQTLKVTEVGHLNSEVNKIKIKIKHADCLTLTNLYQGQKLLFSNIPKELQCDHDMTLSSLVKPHMQGQNVTKASSLIINDKLLHYVLVYILSP